MRFTEKLVVEFRRTTRRTVWCLVMVANGDTVRNSVLRKGCRGILQPIHRIGCIVPLCRIAAVIAVLDAIAEVSDKRDVPRALLAHDPIGLGGEHIWPAAIEAGDVILRVGKD